MMVFMQIRKEVQEERTSWQPKALHHITPQCSCPPSDAASYTISLQPSATNLHTNLSPWIPTHSAWRSSSTPTRSSRIKITCTFSIIVSQTFLLVF
ncbi:hypothetical protein CHARACLAT_015252 [Characodon lateralis]|uniref:Uncharacterized protein n=1 Tax=Characodon lateralis TaxID=208331 RepID=A0ABU7D713_9TELE|nr:hypothetical protein [Characodon lateralis]